MKSTYAILLAFFMLLSLQVVKADLAVEGEHDVQIELINAKDFPKYKFFIKYQTYTYNMGYQPAGVNVVDVEAGKHVATGDRGSASYLYARGPKGEWKSKVEVGGSVIDHTDGVSYALDRIKIKKLNPKGKVIELEVVERQLIGEGGKVIGTIQKGAIDSSNFLWTMPLACGLGLLLFFLYRRRAAAKAA